jgi:hypothetical protein
MLQAMIGYKIPKLSLLDARLGYPKKTAISWVTPASGSLVFIVDTN